MKANGFSGETKASVGALCLNPSIGRRRARKWLQNLSTKGVREFEPLTFREVSLRGSKFDQIWLAPNLAVS